jgi:betaine-homocysteine S-methyltransferase
MKKTLNERLNNEGVICAEGYLFELERRGYLQAGTFVPEVALDHPEALAQLHRDFVRAGSDIVQAFTYNGHREKMRIIGKEDLLEPLNRQALSVAAAVAGEFDDQPPLVAGNISNSNIFDPTDAASKRAVEAMFEEMVGWAVDARVDVIIAETLYFHEEADIALKVIKRAGLDAVVTLGLMGEHRMLDGPSVEEACARLADAGADVVGMNCFRGPETMLPYLQRIRDRVTGHVAALPVPYRTTDANPTFFNLKVDCTHCRVPHETAFPTALDPYLCNRYEIRAFAETAWAMGIRYLGVCCGAAPIHIREVAEALGRHPPASRYSPDMSKHFLFGSDPSLKPHITGYAKKA